MDACLVLTHFNPFFLQYNILYRPKGEINMHSLKTSCVGQVLALAKPHDSVGKRTRNRIPKEERKTLVESFIKK